MACNNCKCHITENDLRDMDYKRFNELLNELSKDEICAKTSESLQNMIKEIDKNK